MKTRKALLVLAVLALASGACGVLDSVLNSATGGSNNLHTVTQLWSDVPRMDGLTVTQVDMPLPVKLLMSTAFGNLGRLNKPGEDQTTGNVDWIVFTTLKTPADVQNFYTAARMKAAGWDAPSEESSCMSGSDQGIPTAGAFCIFQKKQGATETQLVILTTQDDSTKQTSIFFLRLESKGTPTP